MNYLGIDVHKHESQVAVLDDDGEIDREIRVENANLDEIAEEYAGAKAVIEATSNYYTIYDTLDEYRRSCSSCWSLRSLLLRLHIPRRFH